ncbi:MAG: hypothetical protein AAF799_02270 [Myxococcota bacterium]
MVSRRVLTACGLSAGLFVGCSDRAVVPTADGGGSTSEVSVGSTSGSPSVDGSTSAATSAGNATGTSVGSTAAAMESGPVDEGTDSCPFICDPDGGPPPIECSVVDQDCPAGQKCVWAELRPGFGRRNWSRCIEVTGDREPFEPCSLPNGIGFEITDDCGPESYCLEVYGTADHGFCAPFVGDDYGCDAYPGTDLAVENGSDFPAACLHYECQPLVPSTCPDGMQCTFYPAWLYGSMKCWSVPPETDLPVGAECDFGQCGEGKLCAPADWLPDCSGERCCTEWCDLQAPECATPGTTCEFFPVWNYQDDPEFDWLGACLLPEIFEEMGPGAANSLALP